MSLSSLVTCKALILFNPEILGLKWYYLTMQLVKMRLSLQMRSFWGSCNQKVVPYPKCVQDDPMGQNAIFKRKAFGGSFYQKGAF